MNRIVFAIVLFVGLANARAQSSADNQYLAIYSLMEQADSLNDAHQPQQALADYVEAQGQLQEFQKIYPGWNPKILDYRLNYLAEKIAEMTAQIPATNSPALATAASNANSKVSATNSATASLTAEVSELRAQIQNLQNNNTELEAKLKEALAAQPAIIDSRELANAQEQIRSLMKENDLLKVSLSQGHVTTVVRTDTNALAQAQAALTETNKKLSEQMERVNQLTLENQSLQARIQSSLTGPEAMEALRQENELLKNQLAKLRAGTTNTSDVSKLNSDLADARTQITKLQSQVDVDALERAALEDRVRQLQSTNLSSAVVAKPTENEPRIAELTNEINMLRSRLAVDEARAVPYTPAELALFKSSAPQLANSGTEERSVKELPSGSAQLVAEAQKYYAAKQFDKAEDAYLKILQHDENNGIALANLAMIELQQNKLDDAEKHIRAALAESPDDSYNLLVLGEIKFDQRKFDDALNALSRAAALDPRNPEIENFIGATLAQKGLRAQAETAFRQAIQLDPNYADAHNNLAVIYINQQPPLPELARWHYEKAVENGEPRNPALEKLLAEKGAPVSIP